MSTLWGLNSSRLSASDLLSGRFTERFAGSPGGGVATSGS